MVEPEMLGVLATCAYIWLLTAISNICLIVTHIEGRKNAVADLLSRWTYSDDNIQILDTLLSDPVWINTRTDLTLLNHDL